MPLTPEERRERNRAASRRWYEKNRSKITAKRRAYNKLWRQNNKDRRSAINKRWRENIRDKVRAIHRRKQLADPNRQWRNKLKRYELEAGRPKPQHCEVCGRSDLRIAFDHCHQRGHFRGWLCNACNLILGYAQDDPNRLIMLAAYLKRNATLIPPQLALPGI